jgi:2-oxoglutarate dehydrogenase E2 component (dihydrolipoamide succinyltransferase)
MAIEIKAPQFPESVEEGSIATWHKQVGESVSRDELIVDIETDKTVLEVVAAADGVLTEVMKQEGDVVLSQELIGKIEAGAVASAPTSAAQVESTPAATLTDTALAANPAAKKLAEENNIDLSNVKGTGKDGRILKEDVQNVLSASTAANTAVAVPSAPAKPAASVLTGERIEKRVPMTRLRATIAKRLLDAQHNSAMLTTFNEVNMGPLMELRQQYKDLFEKTHNGTRLGFMGFFVKAAAEALKRFPAVNASIDGNDMVYHGYYDIGVAVSTER